ncbi:MAG: preprotein translocase subunit SecY [Emergencia timonensis]|uniref:Protein translocase subunit SecY n=1 Tax=Emergencia timonensis TaxID=1776384 RepID=A0A415DTG6_9FIRM|nr:preprotein translocase subunit SecY [Emergencia timonensis]MBS6178445.1 preprotein translocase subunit SecY [Clostridiales bacterium]MCB6477791.1 preprotein translocase subunit SecY [Emergencia timonensis]RHJ83179.1 preprotein translocase subunit SecY [Emergencia timonensis]WNX90761.1 preprotein translocase subunit SecY [Emergencia timonensis]
MLKTISQAFKVAEIRSKIIFTLLMLVVFRIGSNIPVPGINRSALAQVFAGDTGLFDLFDLFSGGAFSNFTIFALSITPYITASIIIQLLTIAFPYFERLAKEGQEGRKKMAQITRYLTIVLAVIQALGLTVGLFRQAVVDQSWFSFVVIILVLTAGTAFLMWLGEQINEKGIGNGISLIIFGGIVARLPSGLRSLWTQYSDGTLSIITLLLFAVFAIVVILGVIEVQQGTRRIPVQYAKRVVGRKMYGGQSTHIPLKVNQAGVIPVIFALSILQFPLTVTYFFPDSGFTDFITKWLSPAGNPGVWVYAVLNVLLIIFFNYFYTAVTFNPVEVAQNMKANGGFIPGIRPGKATIEYLNKVMSRISFVGAIFLAVIATMPTLVSQFSGLDMRFGGTSLLIAVGVALDTMKQLENQMVMRNYQGFLK